jgi:hypothetical protein
MQIPNPGHILLNIGGCNYRCYPNIMQLIGVRSERYEDNDETVTEEDLEILAGVKKDSTSGLLTLEMKVPRVFHGFLIGKGKSVLEMIQKESGAVVRFPPINSNYDKVILTSQSNKSILKYLLFFFLRKMFCLLEQILLFYQEWKMRKKRSIVVIL